MTADDGAGAARASGARRIFGNTILLSGGQGVGLASMAVWTIAVARYIGPERYGFYALAQAVVSILVIVVGLGLDQVMTRDVAQDPALARPYLRRFAILKVLTGLVVLGGYLALRLAGDPTPAQVSVLLIVTALGAVQSFNGLVMSLLYAQDAMASYVVAQSANFVSTMVTGLVVIALDGSFQTVLLLSLASSVVQLALSSAAAVRRLGPSREIAPAALGTLLRRGAPFAAVTLITVLHANLLIILLEATGFSSASVGRFAAAQRIAAVFMIVPGMVSQVLTPALSRAYAQARESFAGMFDRAYRYVLLLSLPAAAALAAIGPELLELLYGEEYAPAGGVLRILALALAGAVSYVVGPALIALDEQATMARIHAANLVVMVAAAYLLMPPAGARGAAWALVAGGVTAAAVYSRLMYRRLALEFPALWAVKTTAAAAVTGAACFAAAGRVHFAAVALVVAPAVFLVCGAVLRILDSADRQYVKGILLPARGRAG